MSRGLNRLLRRDKGTNNGLDDGSDTGTDEGADAAVADELSDSTAATGESQRAADEQSEEGKPKSRLRLPSTGFGTWLNRPMTSFHLIIAVAALLTSLGLIMVLSASGVESYGNDGSAWLIFGKQVMWTVVGLIAFYAGLRLSVRFIRRIAFSSYAFTCILLVLVLVPGIGNLVNGSRKWFVVAGFSMQPSELAKVAFAIWGAHLLAARRAERAGLREMLVPLVPGALISLGLIMMQPDLGQTVSLGVILLGLLWYVGLDLKVFVGGLGMILVAGAAFSMSAGYRSDRVRSWLDPENDPMDTGYQARQAKFALAHGGIFGDGLGQGVAKWNYLPNAHNDFIFAIIGEELGLVGAVGLLGLFGLFAYTGMRIARRSVDPFLRLLTATTTLWVLGQAFINIGYVIGLLPVTGIQLPLISAGGTSTATTLFMIGIMANAARQEPEAVAALRAGSDDKVNRLLRLPVPKPYAPSSLESFRDRKRSQPAAKPVRKTPRETARRASAASQGASRRALPRDADRSPRRSGGNPNLPKRHHGSGQQYAGQRPTRRVRALEGQRYG